MPKIDDIILAEQKRLEGVLRAAYDAGREDARTDMLQVLSGDSTKYAGATVEKPTVERKRAPRGLPRKFVSRVLYENNVIGTTPQDIVDAAVTEEEKMIAASTIRSELRKGEKDGLYRLDNGYWSLTPSAFDDYEQQDKETTTASEQDSDAWLTSP